MFASNEFERADYLEIAYLAAALTDITAEFRENHAVGNHHEILKRGKELIASMLAGSLLSTQQERERLLPEGAGLYASVRAYGFARRAWSAIAHGTGAAPKTQKDVRATLEAYIACLEGIEGRKPVDQWSRAERGALEEVGKFFASLERMLVGELNSKRAEALARPF